MALSQTALAFASDASFRGPLETATYFGSSGVAGDGPFFQIWLEIEDAKISRASYQTHGCPSSMAVGGGLCRLIQGRELRLAQTLTAEDLIAFIGHLPEGKEYCYRLAIEALADAKEK